MLAPIAVKFTVGLDWGPGAVVCIETGSGKVIDIATGKGAEVAADLVACESVVTSLKEVEDPEATVVDRASVVDEVMPLGRIQNCRLQNPRFASAFTSPKASAALMAKGASQSGSQVMVQSSVLSE